MKTITRSSGLKVNLPDQFSLVEPPASRGATRGPAGRAPGVLPMPGAAAPAETGGEIAGLAAALRGQGFELIDTLSVEPPAIPPGQVRAAPPPDGHIVEAEISLGADEQAAVLAEQDGFYAWHFESDEPAAPGATRTRGPQAGPRSAVIRIRLGATQPAGTRTRGFVTDFVVARAQVLIFKFAGRFLLEKVGQKLEEHVQTGIIRLVGDDPLAWVPVSPGSYPLPADRAPHILLFVHGTFSSTRGGFGALGATPWGRAFLAGARANYDVVLGFEHPTLTVDPLANAQALLDLLQAHLGNREAHVDIICHSRGGIVVRSLVERLLPPAGVPWRCERIVFVAAVNGGTELATPANWRTLIDLYTNLAAGACRAIGMFPAAALASAVMAELIKSLGSLVKVLAAEAITAKALPGLAAMEPAGDFITDLNREQPGQPTPENSLYYAVTSEFNAQLGPSAGGQLAGQFVKLAADGLVDRLMQGKANDLVVNVDSMTAIDRATGVFVKDTLAFESNATIYHTNYFLQPQVTTALARWLQFVAPAAAPSPAAPTRGLLPPGAVAREIPARIDTNFLVMEALDLGQDVADLLRQQTPGYVVLERMHNKQRLCYAFPTEEVLAAVDRAPAVRLIDSLQLHEHEASPAAQWMQLPKFTPSSGGRPTTGRMVAFAGQEIIGVVESAVRAEPISTLVQQAQRSIALVSVADHISVGRLFPPQARTRALRSMSVPAGLSAYTRAIPKMNAPPAPVPRMRGGDTPAAPAMGAPGGGDGGAGAPPPGTGTPMAPGAQAETTVTCHVRAEMDDEVLVDTTTSVDVVVSREVIAAVNRAISVTAGGVIRQDVPLVLELIPIQNFTVVGDARHDTPPPQPGKPLTFVFDVRPTGAGNGAVLVRVRQGGIPFVNLTLHCRIVAARSGPTSRRPETATIMEPPTGSQPLHQLTIFELERGGQRLYQFEFYSPTLGYKHYYYSSAFTGERLAYIKGVYEDIEKRWLGSHEDFDEFQNELRDLGAGLWDELLPADLQSLLWKHRDVLKDILVFSEEPFIPWELVHLKQPDGALPAETRFFGQMGLVRWLHNITWPTETLQARPGRCHYVIPDYPHPEWKLPAALQEAAFLEAQFKAGAVDPHPKGIHALLNSTPAFDLLHFACHGVADTGDIARAELMLEGTVQGANYVTERLRASTIENGPMLIGEGGAKPIVVLNACQTGRQGYKLTSIGGFAPAFLRKGAGMFVAASWAVGDQPARTFTETLYARLKAGDTLATASTTARNKAKEARDATWLAYTVYGNPHARLR